MGMAKACCSCCCCVLVMVAFAGLMVLAVKNACVVPFITTVDEASLARMSLAAPVTAGHNGSTATPSSLSYDLALVVALRWYYRRAVGFSSAAPLEAELRFLGRPLGRRARLGGAEQAAATGYLSEMVYRLAFGPGVNATTTLALGPGEAAAFAAESAAGVFKLELVIAGEFESTVLSRSRWCGVRVTCPLRLSVSTPSVAAAVAPAPPFASVECKS
ncbi:unnamed protein product [Urochloa decumbens]|uniref:Late embryogenesis abundant protein LEA-2 subgroup domain-containing protein n=1 Tax=Urochloa decumbens TaxID=240449 RepID=A0ABC9FUH3_9POAL